MRPARPRVRWSRAEEENSKWRIATSERKTGERSPVIFFAIRYSQFAIGFAMSLFKSSEDRRIERDIKSRQGIRRIEKAISTVFDLRPGAIIRDLDLLRPIYAQTAAYGHFGRTDVELPWEQLNKVDDLKASV